MRLGSRAMKVVHRVLLAVVAALLVGAGCASSSDSETNEGDGASSAEPVPVEQVAESPEEDVPSALDDMTADGLPEPLVDPSEVRSGGPPPDGIPPIDEPKLLAADEVDFLSDEEPVLALDIDGDARAYPVQIMIWHEIVNDTVGGVPVAVTYCPLCNTAVAVDRRVGDRVLSFGTSGSLYQSSLVMYDRQTESLWSHVTGRAIAGVLTGTELEKLLVTTVSWRDWRDAHPDGRVLSRDTGADRDYGTNPYPGYDAVGNPPFLFEGEVDGRLDAKTRVVGFGQGEAPTAIRLEPLLDEGVIDTEVDGRPVVAWALPGTASALDKSSISGGRDVGATGVFDARLDGMELSFTRVDDGFVDDQTNSRWDVFGTAVEGPLAGQQLEAITHVDTFWFAWAAFEPRTLVVPEI